MYLAGDKFPRVPKSPTKEAAHKALDYIIETLFVHYAFVADPPDPTLPPRVVPPDSERRLGEEPSANRSVALSGAMTMIYRTALPTSMIHAYSATAAGSGKSKLLDVNSLLGTGHVAPVFTIGETIEEQEKRVGGLLLEGATIIPVDNVTDTLDCAILAQASTQPLVKIRILRTSDLSLCPNVAVIYITGNNLALFGDLPRRGLRCVIDPQVDQPEKRKFPYDPVEQARRYRGELVVALLTLWRAYFLAGCP